MRTFDKDTTHVQVRVGERFALELPAAATAGFTWMPTGECEVAVLDAERIRSGGPALGAASIQSFELTATRPGTGTWVLVYKRPWESGAGQRRAITIVVAP